MSEKTEKATPHKLKKAKEKGQVSKSTELTTYITLLVGLIALVLLIPRQVKAIQSMMSHLLHLAGTLSFNTDTLSHLTRILFTTLIMLWLPLIVIVLISITLSTLVQTGVTWSPAALVPNLNRLNLGQGLKRLLSINNMFDATKSLLKLILSLILVFFIFKAQLGQLIVNALSQPQVNPQLLTGFILNNSLKACLLLLALAFIDKRFTQWKFNKDQKMSKHEVKEEYRQKEGDPKIKNKIKQLQLQLRKKTAALKQVKNADVIITNPTHIAIALKYERGEMPAPKVLYKAQDKMVGQVKELAKRHGIPIIEHKILARMLHYSTDLNQYISRELFPLTAQVFRDLYRQGAAYE